MDILHASTQSETATAARKYFDWNWNIIPLKVGSKLASGKWKDRQTRPPTLRWVQKSWPATTQKNIGILCGQSSGGLIVRDFDDATEYEEWASAYPGLARRLPTVKTRRGYHVYLIDSNGHTKSLDFRPASIGEIKGNGTYVVAPGSTVHLDNAGTEVEPFTYTWTNPPEFADDDLPIIPAVELASSGLSPSGVLNLRFPNKNKENNNNNNNNNCFTQHSQHTQHSQQTQHYQHSQSISERRSFFDDLIRRHATGFVHD